MISAFYGPRAGAAEHHDDFMMGGDRIVFVDLHVVPDDWADAEPANDNGKEQGA